MPASGPKMQNTSSTFSLEPKMRARRLCIVVGDLEDSNGTRGSSDPSVITISPILELSRDTVRDTVRDEGRLGLLHSLCTRNIQPAMRKCPKLTV
eukprot:8335078-Pyramimonas_sp.AAC.2